MSTGNFFFFDNLLKKKKKWRSFNYETDFNSIISLTYFVLTAVDMTDICLKQDLKSECQSHLKEGIVQVRQGDDWFSICSNKYIWKEKAATLACRQLGFKGGWPYNIEIANRNGTSSTHQYLTGIHCRDRKLKYYTDGSLFEFIWFVCLLVYLLFFFSYL